MRNKKVICLICALAMTFSMLAGCGSQEKNSSGKVVMTVGQYEICEDELMLYAVLELLSGTIQYQDLLNDEEKYKDQVIDSLVEARMAVPAARKAGMDFTADDEATRDKLIGNFTNYVPKEVRDKYGISDDLIKSVFQDTSIMNKLENDTRNEIGKQLTADAKEKYKDYNFQRIYYLTFPKVKADDEGNPLVGDDGNYVPLDDAELAAKKADAEKAVKEINDGADAKEIAKKYGVDTYSEEASSYVGAYSEDMNDIMDKLTAGMCTEVFDSTTSYYAIAVLSDHDSELLDSFAANQALSTVDAELAAKVAEWKAEADKEGGIVYKDDTWKNFSLIDMALYLDEKQLMK